MFPCFNAERNCVEGHIVLTHYGNIPQIQKRDRDSSHPVELISRSRGPEESRDKKEAKILSFRLPGWGGCYETSPGGGTADPALPGRSAASLAYCFQHSR
jgi:hypothetical protein